MMKVEMGRKAALALQNKSICGYLTPLWLAEWCSHKDSISWEHMTLYDIKDIVDVIRLKILT